MNPPALHRVKLYKLNETGGWDDKGTGGGRQTLLGPGRLASSSSREGREQQQQQQM
jgi:hypothetical protein